MTRIVEPLLGTRAEVCVAATDADGCSRAEDAVIAEVGRLETIFTVFDHTSALHDLRRTGSTDVAELREVVGLAESWRGRTGGAFQPRGQPLLDLWDRAEATGTVPSMAGLRSAVDALSTPTGYASLDLNAIAKGWIAERALKTMLDASPDVSAGWLSLGGDVVHGGDGSLVVGIEDPKRPYDNVAPLATVELSNEALATSGGARRWWTVGQRRYSKVLDPRTGLPAEGVASATVVAPDGAAADVLATVGLVLARDEMFDLMQAAGASCLLVDADGSVSSSSDRFRPSSTR